MSLNNPSTWRFIAGSGTIGMFTPEDVAQHVMGLGANGSYAAVYVDYWTATDPQNLQSQDHAKRFFAEIKRLGGLTHLQVYPWDWWGVPGTWEEHDANVIFNINGAQDIYIRDIKKVVSDLQPDICQIMNEVIGTGPNGTGDETYWTNYIAFCNRYMAEMNTAKPNMIFSVSSVPFWNLKEIAYKNFTIPAGCKLIYDYHYYYSFEGVRPDAAHQGYDSPEQLPYWDGNLALGKQLTHDMWLNDVGIKSLLDQGKIVIFDEQGVNINNPNFTVWMKDAIDFCLQYGIGFSYLNNAGSYCYAWDGQLGHPATIIPGITDGATCSTIGGWWAFNHSPAAFWGCFDWNLNAIGQTWKQIIDSLSPITFAGKNWTAQKGSWSIT